MWGVKRRLEKVWCNLLSFCITAQSSGCRVCRHQDLRKGREGWGGGGAQRKLRPYSLWPTFAPCPQTLQSVQPRGYSWVLIRPCSAAPRVLWSSLCRVLYLTRERWEEVRYEIKIVTFVTFCVEWFFACACVRVRRHCFICTNIPLWILVRLGWPQTVLTFVSMAVTSQTLQSTASSQLEWIKS